MLGCVNYDTVFILYLSSCYSVTHCACAGCRWHFNMAMIFISFLFFIFIMVTWEADNKTKHDNTTNYS